MLRARLWSACCALGRNRSERAPADERSRRERACEPAAADAHRPLCTLFHASRRWCAYVRLAHALQQRSVGMMYARVCPADAFSHTIPHADPSPGPVPAPSPAAPPASLPFPAAGVLVFATRPRFPRSGGRGSGGRGTASHGGQMGDDARDDGAGCGPAAGRPGCLWRKRCVHASLAARLQPCLRGPRSAGGMMKLAW